MDRLCDARVVCGNHQRARLRRRAITIALCFLAHPACFAQAGESSPPPDAPSTTQSQSRPHAANPVQGGMHFVQLLERKSLVFPDLATSKEPFGTGEKFKVAVNNSESLSPLCA